MIMNAAERPGSVLDIPDNLTIPQFFFESHHPTRPEFASKEGLLIDEASDRKSSLAELRRRSILLANAIFVKWHIGEGDVVALLGPNHIDYPVVIWAIHMLGGIITSADPSFITTEDLTYQLRATGTSLIITHPEFADKVGGVAEAVDVSVHRILLLEAPKGSIAPPPYVTMDAILVGMEGSYTYFPEQTLKPGEGKTTTAFYFFSCGLTGTLKPLAISHYAVISNIVQRAVHFQIADNSVPEDTQRFRVGDVALAVLPFSYIYGMTNILFLMYCGMTSIVVPRFDFQGFFKTVTKYQVTHLLLIPSQIVLISKNPMGKKFDLSCVKYCSLGGQTLSLDFTPDFARLFPNCTIGQIYGLSEMGSAVAITPNSHKGLSTSASVGKFLPGVRFEIVKDDGALAAPGEEGQLWVTGPSVASNYLNSDRANHETFKNGWVRTGDKVSINEHGELFIVGRYKAIFKVRGLQVSPDELQVHLRRHPDVTEACVVGVPDQYSGEVPVAFVVLKDEALTRVQSNEKEMKKTKISILKHVADAKANYKWIGGGVEIESSFPMTPLGRVNRQLLRTQAIEARERGTRKISV